MRIRQDVDVGPVTPHEKEPSFGVEFVRVDHEDPLLRLISILTLEPAFEDDQVMVGDVRAGGGEVCERALPPRHAMHARSFAAPPADLPRPSRIGGSWPCSTFASASSSPSSI